MIDRYVLRIPFREFYDDDKKDRLVFLDSEKYEGGIADIERICKLTGVPVTGALSLNGNKVEYSELRHVYESIPSSYASLAFKIFDRMTKSWPCIEIKASPAKLLQGHNVYGSEDFRISALSLLYLMLHQYPKLRGVIQWENIEISSFDLTYSARADNPAQALQVLTYFGNLSYGQTRNRNGYLTTAYFGGGGSVYKELKIYLKYPEVEYYIKECKRKGMKQAVEINRSVLPFAESLLRFEATLKKRWLQKRGIPTNLWKFLQYVDHHDDSENVKLARKLWAFGFADVFKPLEGQSMKVYKDDEIQELLCSRFSTVSAKTGQISYAAAMSAFRTYRAIKFEGYTEVHNRVSSSTFSRHLKMLKDIGISRAYLQNLDAPESNLIPLIRFTDIDFGAQVPEDFREPQMDDLLEIIRLA